MATYRWWLIQVPSASLPPAQTVCSGVPTQTIRLNANVPGATFNWTGSASNSITGYIASGSSDSIPSQTLVNNGTSQGRCFIRLHHLLMVVQNLGNYVISVEPSPTIALPAPQTICSGGSMAPVVLTSSLPGASFNWASSASGSITGNIASGTGNIPAQTLTNSGSTADTVIYTITTVADGCNGNPANYLVVIHPQLSLTIPNVPQTVCSGETSQEVDLTSPVPGLLFRGQRKYQQELVAVLHRVLGLFRHKRSITPRSICYRCHSR